MKKLIILSITFISATGAMAQTQRTVLFELFTGENSPPDYETDTAVYALINANPAEVLLLQYAEPIPSPGTLCQEDSADAAIRLSYYSANSVPWGEQDGLIWDSTFLPNDGYQPITWCTNMNTGQPYSGYLTAEYAIPSPFTIAVWDTFTFSTDSFYATVQVTAAQAVNMSSLQLQMALVEDLQYSAPVGNNHQTYFPHTVRGMYPSGAGTNLPAAWNSGQTVTYTFSGTVPAYVRDKSKLNFIAFIQDSLTQKVQQSAITPPFSFSADIGTTGFVGNFANCPASTYTPVINLTNSGQTTITSCNIQETVDNVSVGNVPWTGTLNAGSSINASLAALNITPGVHTLQFTLSSPNGVTDPNPANNIATFTFNMPGAATTSFLAEGFENGQPSAQGWQIYTVDNDSTWRVVNTGDTSAHSLMLDNYDDLFYDFLLNVDFLYAPPISLAGYSHAVITFDRAGQQINFGNSQYSDDTLYIDVSSDCGNTWTTVYEKDGANLATSNTTQSVNSAIPFVPGSSDWVADSADISVAANNADVIVRFRNINGDGNNFYLDNIDFGSSNPVSQSIATGAVNAALCTGEALDVAYMASGTFGAGNVFTAQLSDSAGNFANAVDIGILSGTGSGSIQAVIPANTLSGTGYRIRVISSSPADTGSNNGTNIQIQPVAAVTVSVSGNTTFCQNDSVILTAPAANTYSWSNGATTQSITVKQSGSYTVLESNAACPLGSVLSDTTNIQVDTFSTPVANIAAPFFSCPGSLVTLNVSVLNGGTSPAYQWFTNGNNAGSNSPAYTSTFNDGDSVWVRVTSNQPCVLADTVYSNKIYIQSDTLIAQQLCLVSVDTATNYNEVIWDKLDRAATQVFYIYRAYTPDSVYDLIAAVPGDSLSLYEDITSQPDSFSYRYKMNLKDTCGNFNVLSNYHQSIWLSYSTLTDEFSWTPYEIENTPSPVSSYDFYRDSLGNGNWQLLESLPNTALSAVDTMRYLYPNASYKVIVVLATQCYPTRAYNTISSNIMNHVPPTGIAQNEAVNPIRLLTNPVSDQAVLVNISGPVTVRLINNLGQNLGVVYKGSDSRAIINLSNYAAGLYYLRIADGNSQVTIKVARFK